MKKRSRRKHLLVISLVMVLLSGMIAGCVAEEVPDENKEMIRQVVELEFTGPDTTLIDYLWSPEYRLIEDGMEKNPELDKYVDAKYGEFFTKSALETFIRTGGTMYHDVAYEGDYILRLQGVEITQSENPENRYTFEAEVVYSSPTTEEKVKTVEGTVMMSTKENKIGKFEYTNDNGLKDALYQMPQETTE